MTDRPLLHPYHPTAVPYVDNDGNVVTITELQWRAIRHALMQWSLLCRAEGSDQADGHGTIALNIEKSRALGRLLLQGKPLFAEKPPRYLSACNYWLWDEENEAATEAFAAQADQSERQPEYTICEDTGRLAIDGACPLHHGDACLRQFVPKAAR